MHSKATFTSSRHLQKMEKRPTALQAALHIFEKMVSVQPLEQERMGFLNSCRLRIHIAQRMVRLLFTPFLRLLVKHPLGWPLPQELLCTLMFGILQSRQVSAWRALFSAAGDLAAWVPVEKQRLQTGSCSSVWVRLPAAKQPQHPRAHINLVFFHGGAFVAGDALMYLGTFAYWLRQLAAAGISCSILSVDYPLAPEHPFPAAVEAAAGMVGWLAQESGETAPYILAGDSAGGNLVLTGLALLREQGRLAALPRLPEALVLLSPAVDLSNTSVFARGESVSSHIDADSGSHGAAAAAGGTDVLSDVVSSHTTADGGGEQSSPSAVLNGQATAADKLNQQQPNSSSVSSDGSYVLFSDLKQQILQHNLQQQHLPRQQQHLIQQQHRQHRVGGPAGPLRLLLGLAGEAKAAWAAHRSKAGTAAAAAAGWFDYLPGSSVADNIHHYLQDAELLCHPLVSPALLPDLTGLSRQGMLLVAGGAELMWPDIAAFASKAIAAGVAVQYHEEAGECHCYAVLTLPHLLRKSHVVLDYVEKVALAAATATAAAPAPAAKPGDATLQQPEAGPDEQR